MAKQGAWQICYRTGGTENFRWELALPVATKAEAQQQAAEIRRGGRPALINTAYNWANIGVPETYGDYKQHPDGTY
ncbi:MAG: hypothetical protein IT318_20215 [Anaerolineales bacterium]|nr:hypothetical protein [Anaerolineales bacterium]